MPVTMTQLLIVVVVGLTVGIGIRFVRARLAARNRAPTHVHGLLMKRAEAHADKSPFLRNVCREFKANGHISDRQAEQVAKALARHGKD